MKRDSKRKTLPQKARKSGQPAYRVQLIASIILIVSVSFAVYVNTLSHGFVYDDKMQVVENHWIKNVKYVGDIFSSNTWGFKGSKMSNYYRPLMYVVFMLNYRISGLNPVTFHGVNMLFHAGVSVLVFLLASTFFREYWSSTSTSHLFPSFTAGILFATHPIHTEAVAWVSGLPELSFTLFFVLSLYLYVRSREIYSSTYFFSVISFFAATLFKETALTLPVILVAYDLSFRRAQYSMSDYLKRYVPFLLITGAYFLMRFHALGAFAPQKHHTEMSAYQLITNVLPLFSQYLEKLLLPVNLNAFYVFRPVSSVFEAKGITSLIIAGGFVAIAVLSWKRNRAVFFSLCLIAIPLTPVLYIPGVGENAFAERYLYLPSVGFVLLISMGLMWARVHMPGGAMGFAAIPVLVTSLYSIGTIHRNKDWKDDYALFSDMVKKSPDGAIPHTNLGNVLLHEKGQADVAIEQYRVALEISPHLAEAHNNLGVAYGTEGMIDQAIDQFNLALSIKANDPEALNNLGLAYAKSGLIDRAIEQYQRALEVNPYFAEAHDNLGLAYTQKGLTDKAIIEHQRAIELNPEFAQAYNNLGLTYAMKGLTDKAIADFRKAVLLKPDYADSHNNLGVAYGNRGMIDEAISQFEEAATLNPAFLDNLNEAREMKRLRENRLFRN